MKYREYIFDNGKLKEVRLIPKLTKGARKQYNVWVVPPCYNVWSKICLVDSDIDFGTGIREPWNVQDSFEDEPT